MSYSDSLGNLETADKTFATSFNFVAAVTVNAFVTITAGTAANRNLRLSRIRISGPTLTTAASLRMGLVRYSTQPTGGTSTLAVASPMRDDSFDTSTAIVNIYTVAPTGGLATPVTIQEFRVNGVAPGATAQNELVVDFDSDSRIQMPTTIGAVKCLGIAFLAAPATAVTMSVSLTFTEGNG